MFRKIKGQAQVVNLLQNAILNDRIAQAYLFHGGDGVGKFMTALYMGMAVNCLSSSDFRPCGVCASCHKFLSFEHPDFVYLFPTINLNLSPEGEIKNPEALKQYEAYIKNKMEAPWQEYYFSGSTEIRKESISYLIRKLELSINEGRYRVVIIEHADMMNTATANAFLKTLEEPPKNTMIILITERLPQMLPTILSRCQPVYFKPLSESVIQEVLFDTFQIDSLPAKSAARMSGGNLKNAIRLTTDSTNTIRTKAFELLKMAMENDTLSFVNQCNTVKPSGEAIRDLIAYIGVLANDLAIVRYKPDMIVNMDKTELLSSLAHEDIADRIPDFLRFLDDLNRKLEGNVNPSLIQINLYLALRDLVA